MNVNAVIAEYNPFHKGHAYQIRRTREQGADYLIAVMSGNFVQRSESAILGKRSRTEMALKNGVDLVIELPLPWATASAETFAFGGVYLSQATGIVNRLSFGSESGDTELLQRGAKALKELEGHSLLKKYLSTGLSFPAAREQALKGLCVDEDIINILNSPNDILGLEYCKALLKLNSQIEPFAISRKGAGHDSTDEQEGFLSASEIRRRLLGAFNINQGEFNRAGVENFLPTESLEILEHDFKNGHAPADFKTLKTAILADLRRKNSEFFIRLSDVSEGLENRLAEAACRAESLEHLYKLIKTKRYTLSRVRRLVLSAYLEVFAEYSEKPPPYIRILGFNERGRSLLPLMKKSASLPLVTRYAEIAPLCEHAREIFELEARATAIYNLCLPQKRRGDTEYTDEIVII